MFCNVLRRGICVVISSVCLAGSAQPSQQLFKIINWFPEANFTLRTNYSILKDSTGFLWFTSPDGLWRFDGSSFTGFRSSDVHRTIIGKETLGLIEDSLHNIWIGSDSGLNRYDIHADSFQVFPMVSKNISGLNYFIPFHATGNEVWYIDREKGILAINIFTGKKRILFSQVPTSVYYQRYTYTFYDPASQSIWYPDAEGIIRFSLKDGKSYSSLPGEKDSLLRSIPRVIYMVNDTARKCVWFADFNLYQLRLKEKIIKPTPILNGQPDVDINSLTLDKQNRLWIGTRLNGIFIYDPDKNTYQHLYREPGSPNSIQSNAVRYIYCDNDGMVWAGTGIGIDQITSYTAIQHYTDFTANGNDLSSGDVRTFAEGRGGKIWMGTWDAGINIFDPVSGSFEYLTTNNLPGLPSNRIRFVYVDTISSKAWISADEGPGELDLRTRKYKRIVFKDVHGRIVRSNNLLSQHWETLNNTEWLLGTWNGIYTYKKGSDTAYQLPFLADKNIQYISKGNNMFFFTSLDLFAEAYSYENGKWKYPGRPFGTIPVFCIVWDDTSQTWWIGSSHGLFRIDKNFKIVRHYTVNDGLPDNTINAVIADKNGLLWLGTPKGLCTFDKQKETITRVGSVYNSGINYRRRAFLLASNGDVYMGAGDGFDRIQPSLVNFRFPPANIYFKSFTIDKKELGNRVNINRTDKIALKYFQNSINIEMGVLDLYSKGTNQVRYKLEGLTEDWQYGTSQQLIRYRSLAPGSYEFIMEAANTNNEWIGPVKKIKFIISPPFWITWWFRTLCVVVISAIVYSIYYYRTSQLKKLISVRARISQDLHDEIGSTLTSINILSKISQKNLDKNKVKVSEILNKITEQTEDIQQSMSDIVWSVRPGNDKLKDLVIRMREYLGQTAEAKEMTIDFNVDEKILHESLSMEKRQNFFLIFKEAVNNAVKYSGGKKISVSLHRVNSQIKLTIQDDGFGFKESEIIFQNGIKNMHDRARTLRGTIQIQSLPDEGTRVELTCPAT